MARRRRLRRPFVGGLAFLFLLGLLILLPLLADSTPVPGGGTSASPPMELRGFWLGMSLASTDSSSARQVGIPPVVSGVLIVELPRNATSRGYQAGLMPGDVITAVDGTKVADLSELYTLTMRMDGTRALLVEILRQGQAMQVTLPPAIMVPTPQMVPPAAMPSPGAMSPPAAMSPPNAMPQNGMQAGSAAPNINPAPSPGMNPAANMQAPAAMTNQVAWTPGNQVWGNAN